MMFPKQRSDQDFMQLALNQAREAAERDEVPVGAIAVAEDGTILGRAYNQVELLTDGTAHAEMIALTQASSALGDWRLNSVTLYVTKEPCVMCAGAMVNCRLGRLVYGCPDPRSGAAGGARNLLDLPGALHAVAVTGGICADECLQLLQDFFKRRRKTPNNTRPIKQWPGNLSTN